MDTIFLGLQTRNLGKATREMTNPFTGDTAVAYIDEGATSEAYAAGESVLDEFGASVLDEDRFRDIDMGHGRSLSINFGKLGGEVNINGGLTFDAIDIIYRLASAARMLVTSTIDPDAVAVLATQHGTDIDVRWPFNQQVDSAESLLAWAEAQLEAGRIA